MIQAGYKKYVLQFKQPSGTSRGILTEKETWFIILKHNEKWGIGECGILRGLSFDDKPNYQETLDWVVKNIHLGKEKLWEELQNWPSIQFGIEQAFLSLESENPLVLFPSLFTENGIPIAINGLVWMGTPEFMKQQIDQKIKDGFTCVKLKIGALDFEQELALLEYIRQEFSSEKIEIRVDVNGGFNSIDALNKLIKLSELELHSIEQPIKINQHDTLTELCKLSPVDIALDEELIGVVKMQDKENLLLKIRPKYLILKPSLLGGFKGCMQWIQLAEKYKIGWWVTSALESNIGLNAISQWTFMMQNKMPQGLGTGGLYTNNIESSLVVKNGLLYFDKTKPWDFNLIKQLIS